VLAAAKLDDAQGIHTLDVMVDLHPLHVRAPLLKSCCRTALGLPPGDYSLNGLNSQRNEIFELFPDLATTAGGRGLSGGA
jgi:hypothetical protein